jgi:NitT/TauT family transport system permease protein/sulfonate transport system permease protein
MKRPSLAASIAERAIGEGLPIAFLLLWWLTARSLPSFILPGPIETGKTLLQLFIDPAFVGDTLISLARVVGSVILAVILGGALAALARYVPSTAYAVQRRVLPVLNSFPSVGWAILATFWFQPDSASVIFVETLILIPFCAIALMQGIADMDRELLEMGASFSRSGLKIAWKIALPMLLPYVMSSVRIAYGVGWKIALVSELFGVDHGLGYLMLRAEVIGNTAMVFASCFAIVIIFVAGEKLIIDPLARRFAVH